MGKGRSIALWLALLALSALLGGAAGQAHRDALVAAAPAICEPVAVMDGSPGCASCLASAGSKLAAAAPGIDVESRQARRAPAPPAQPMTAPISLLTRAAPRAPPV